MRRTFPIAVLLICSVEILAAKEARISIPELLDPATCSRALQRYLVEAKPDEARSFHWSELSEFGRWNSAIEVQRLPQPDGSTRYLATWRGNIGDEWEWKDRAARAKSTSVTRTLTCEPSVNFSVFQKDGAMVGAESEWVSDALVADLNGDGIVDLVEKGGGHGEGFQCEYLTVGPVDQNQKRTLVVLYNAHPKVSASGNTWGFQCRDTDGDGLYEIELGPLLDNQSIEPKVTFHWDKPGARWIGPGEKPGDHFRVLANEDIYEQVSAIEETGGLGYALAPSPKAEAPAMEEEPVVRDGYEVPPEKLSKPYRFASMAGAPDDAVLAFMAAGRTAWDYVEMQVAKQIAVPDLWTRDPKSAALEYVKRNRPADTLSCYLLSVFNPGNEDAPEEGDVTLSDGPSGCFAPGGAYVHHLHCARDGSFFLYAQTIREWFGVLPTHAAAHYELRKVDLNYDEALQIYRIVWWLGKVRSRSISKNSGDHISGGSTSDGIATVQIVSASGSETITASRAAGHFGTYLGTGCYSEQYDQSAFINLVVNLFRTGVPAHLGARWKPIGRTVGRVDGWDAAAQYTPQELADIRAITGEMLRLFRERKVSAAVAAQAVDIIGEMGWREFAPQVSEAATLLPPPFDHEKRIAEIDGELRAWAQKLGARETTDDAHRRREQAKAARTLSTMGGEVPSPTPAAAKPRPSTAVERKFAAVDALWESRSTVEYVAPEPEQIIADLRTTIPVTLRRLERFDNASALWKWAQSDPEIRSFALPRLAKLDRKLAIRLLRLCEQDEPSPNWKQNFIDARKELEGAPASDSLANIAKLTLKQRAAQIATLRDPKADFTATDRALKALVPENDPGRYADPGIDRVLLDLLDPSRTTAFSAESSLYMAAARRLGPRAWEPLGKLVTASKANSRDIRPALAHIARIHPDPYRERLRELLAGEIKESSGMLDSVLWDIWDFDFRELKGDVERIATSGTEDFDGTMGRSGSNHRNPVNHRFHLARQIATFWSEDDPLTRARLLVAFAIARSDEFGTDSPSRRAQLTRQLAADAKALDEPASRALGEFAARCEANAVVKLGGKVRAETVREIIPVIHAAMTTR